MKRDDWIGADVSARVQAVDASALEGDLEAQGWSVLSDLLTSAEWDELASVYAQDEGFRSRVVMARHGFGKGEYRYFSYPLPPMVQGLRTALYPRIAPLANRWHERMGMSVRFPAHHAEFIARCAAAGQTRPTPLLLQYGAGDYNCLHQDLYGEHVFPLQLAVLLSEPGADFSGGEFVLTEQAAHADAGRGSASDEGRRRRVRRQQPARARNAQRLPREDAPRRQQDQPRPSPHARHHLS